VKYIYSNSTDSSSTGGNLLSESDPIVALAFSAKLPTEWNSNMKQAIRSADLDLIAKTIEEIRGDLPELADMLQSHLDNFDYPEILNLITKMEESDNADK
jgi:TRAP-type mannitol/chloroaromatic compound transport system substrate-binding protein